MRSMVEGCYAPDSGPPSVRASPCHLPLAGEKFQASRSATIEPDMPPRPGPGWVEAPIW